MGPVNGRPGSACKLLGNAGDLPAVAQPAQAANAGLAGASNVGELAEKIGAAAAVDGDVGDVGQIGSGFPQAIGDRLRWEIRPSA